jgi:ATP-dependent protease ClpP protease subunit
MTIKPLARAHAALQALARGDRPNTYGLSEKWTISAAGNQATVHIYDEIGGFGVSASELVPELAALNVEEVEVRLNSPGGDFFDGVAIANALAEHPARVTVHVDGLAASAASVIAMAGDEIVMHPGSRMMIHDALTLTVGNSGDHAQAAQLLDSVSADIAELYASRSGKLTAPEWRESMRAESWYGASEAVQAGLATSAVSRETSPEPAGGDWRELVAYWREKTPSAEPEVATPEAPQAAVLPLSELFCSAYREVIV